MPKVAIFFSIVLFSFVLTNSYAFTTGDLVFDKNISEKINFESGFLQIDSDLFTENDYKRYLIFGTSSQKTDFLKNNSIYGIQSNSGFFYVSTLTEKSASFLISQGYNVIEGFRLDFHIIPPLIFWFKDSDPQGAATCVLAPTFIIIPDCNPPRSKESLIPGKSMCQVAWR